MALEEPPSEGTTSPICKYDVQQGENSRHCEKCCVDVVFHTKEWVSLNFTTCHWASKDSSSLTERTGKKLSYIKPVSPNETNPASNLFQICYNFLPRATGQGRKDSTQQKLNDCVDCGPTNVL